MSSSNFNIPCCSPLFTLASLDKAVYTKILSMKSIYVYSGHAMLRRPTTCAAGASCQSQQFSQSEHRRRGRGRCLLGRRSGHPLCWRALPFKYQCGLAPRHMTCPAPAAANLLGSTIFFTNIHLCSIKLLKMTPAEIYWQFWPSGNADRRHVSQSATG
jgi:hypothetical protein